MAERNYHALEFVPGKSDPERRWALSVKQPLAGMVATGSTPIITKSVPPPQQMIGKRIALHAGLGSVPYNQFSEDAVEWVRAKWGVGLPELRQFLPHGGIIATAKLEAAYKIGRAMFRKVYAVPQNAYGSNHMGRWHLYDGVFFFEQGGDFEGRWVWALAEPKLCAALVPLRGHGGIFDLEGARKLDRERAEEEARGGQQREA